MSKLLCVQQDMNLRAEEPQRQRRARGGEKSEKHGRLLEAAQKSSAVNKKTPGSLQAKLSLTKKNSECSVFEM